VTFIGRPSAATVTAVVFVVLAAAWGGILGVRQITSTSSVLDRLEDLSLDWRYAIAGVREVPRGIMIAAIDDETVRRAGSLSRGVLARIVRGLAAYGPQVVALDILLLDPGPPEGDQELVGALRSTRAVIGAGALFDANTTTSDAPIPLPGEGAIPRPASVLWPQDKFRAVARSGLSNVSTDESGVPRYVPMLFESNGAIIPSFALATAAVALNTDPAIGKGVIKLGARSVDMDFGYHLPLRFYGPRGSIRTVSAFHATDGELDAEDVRGQIVVVGITASGEGDRFATPFERSMPGVEVFATAISNLVAGDGLIRNSFTRRVDAWAGVGLAVGVVLLMAIPNPSMALALTAAMFALWLVLNFAAFREGYWLGIAVPAAASVPVGIGFGVTRLWMAQRSARRLATESETLRRFQAPRLADLLVHDPQFLAKPAMQNAAIVFLDLSGYTGLTEILGPAWTRDLLAALHDIIETAATASQGFVVSYMGDGAMIVFGLPAPQPDDACRALQAIAQLFADISKWLAGLPPVARERLTVRLGGHFGPVVLSRLGAASHQHIAATGDTVNVASRLMEVAKQRLAGIAVSEDLFVAASQVPCELARDASYVRDIVAIRGRGSPLAVRVGELRA
jgi:adenylate cyclase